MNITNQEPTAIVTTSQKEALLNEHKGALYEFLVGKFLAQFLGVEESFMDKLDAKDQAQLQSYQYALYEQDQDLYRQLPKLAQGLASKITEELAQVNFSPVNTVGLTGRQRSYGNLGQESDLILATLSGSVLGLSIKLCKNKSFVNTKSAGAKSFLSKYFHHPEASLLQKDFNQDLDRWYYEFQQNLSEAGEDLPRLPSELPLDLKEKLTQYYAKQSAALYCHFQKLHRLSAQLFLQDLLPLCGFSTGNLWRAITFHQEVGGKRYQLAGHRITKSAGSELFGQGFEWVPPKDEQSSFSLRFQNFELQIRIKPMNAFATSSYKINCSVRFLDGRDK